MAFKKKENKTALIISLLWNHTTLLSTTLESELIQQCMGRREEIERYITEHVAPRPCISVEESLSYVGDDNVIQDEADAAEL